MARQLHVPFILLFLPLQMMAAAEVGDKVVAIQALTLKKDGKFVEKAQLGDFFTVIAVKGKRVQLATVPSVWADEAGFREPLKAIDHFTELLARKPGDSELLCARGRSHQLAGASYLAMLDLNEAVRINPSSETYRIRARVWRDRNEFQKSLDDFNEAVRRDGRSVLAYEGRAYLLLAEERVEAGMADLSKAVELDPRNARLLGARADSHRRLGKFDDATKDIENGLRFDPDSIDVLNARAGLIQSTSSRDDAIAAYTAVLTRDPQCVHALLNRGCLWDQKKEFEKAVRDFTSAIELEPSVFALACRGKAYSGLRNLQSAQADFNRAFAMEPKGKEVFFMCILAHQERGDFMQALSICNRVLKEDPESAFAYGLRAITFSNLQRYEDAANDSDQLVRLVPYSEEGYLSRAYALQHLGKWDQVESDLARGFQLNNYNLSILKQFAMFRAACPVDKLRNGKVAIELAERAIKVSQRKDADAVSALAAAFAETGDFKSAVEHGRVAIQLAKPKDRQELQDRLSQYENRKPYRLK